MSSVVLSGDTSGTVTVTVPAVAGTNTVTIAAQTGTLNAAGPTFSAYQSSQQTISYNAFAKVQLQTEEFDTNNNFDNTTNYRFTPTVAGYYLVTGSVSANVSGSTYSQSAIYKNGAIVSGSLQNTNSGPYNGFLTQKLIYMNGSTDYLELFFVSFGTGTFTVVTGTATTYFQACLVRGA